MISQVSWWILLMLSVAVILNVEGEAYEETKVHIVHLGEREHDDPELVTASHLRMLESLLGSKKDAEESMIHSYRHSFSGFAAHLTDSQVEKISEHPDVVQVTPNSYYKLQTTRAFDYLGLSQSTPKGLLNDAKMGEDVIIGVLDSGVWPESQSFNDKGLGPIPARWKGKCVDGEEFDSKKHCNKKLIGARYYMESLFQKNKTDSRIPNTEYMSAREGFPHGTHVASTALGSFVSNVSNGFEVGTVRGGAPKARLAVYKVCWQIVDGTCAIADTIKAMDDAIADGVDIISISIGKNTSPVYAEIDRHNQLSYGAFHAIARGIPVILAAGNNGPGAHTVQNIAPWIITVAATSLDRWYPTPLALGNNVTLMARTPYKGIEVKSELVYARNSDQITGTEAGKVVLTFIAEGVSEPIDKLVSKVFTVGGRGILIATKRNDVIQVNEGVPMLMIDDEQGTTILKYIISTRSPTIKISSSITLTGQVVSTKVATFSGRGPNAMSPYVLKPDIAAPGVSILAATTPKRQEEGYATESGTSMATPVISGVVALLKSVHPDWSPAAIRSALVTTATSTDPYGEPIFSDGISRKLADPFDFGGGLVNPNKAADPGLIYDATVEDYKQFLCASVYEEELISTISMAKSLYKCPSPLPSPLDLNLPSITIPFLKEDVTITRTVTNVGPVNSIYTLVVEPPLGVKVSVTPNRLVFNSSVKKLSFKVTVSTTHKANSIYYFGKLTWTDGSHKVTIPLSVRTQMLMHFDH